MAVADRRCAEKRCQFLDGHCYCLPGLSSDRGSRFGMNRVDHQVLAPTIKRGIDPANKLIARQDGHDVVPEPPFVFGGVDLALISKVERREQRCPGFPCLLLQPFQNGEPVLATWHICSEKATIREIERAITRCIWTCNQGKIWRV